jgi:protein phosphatase
MFVLNICGATHRGQVREHNGDHILVGRFVKNSGCLSLSVCSDDDFLEAYGLLLCVADGVGGAAADEMASRIALLTLEKEFYAATKIDLQTCTALLRTGVKKANAVVLEASANRAEWTGMSTTLCGVCLNKQSFLAFSAGDSRVYRYRDGLLKRLTQDDTLAAHNVRSGSMTLEQAEHSPESHVLINYLGRKDASLSVREGPLLRDQDSLLICSDGLYDMVDEDNLAELLQRMNAAGLSETRQTEELIKLANQRGGIDNISVILIRVRHESS